MDRSRLERLLEDVRTGRRPVGEAADELRDLPYEDLGFAKLDHHRELRQGMPEAVFAPGKTPIEIRDLALRIRAAGSPVLVTRLTREAAGPLLEALPELRYSDAARVAFTEPAPPTLGSVLVVSAGTADGPVAEETAIVARAAGCAVDRLTDVGVAGIHRLLDARATLDAADVVIVVAGMEGALPSVVGGLVAQPVVAVPTSVGYGTSFGGLTALLAMLNSCASGLAVVNVDNGFGAAMVAARILRRLARRPA